MKSKAKLVVLILLVVALICAAFFAVVWFQKQKLDKEQAAIEEAKAKAQQEAIQREKEKEKQEKERQTQIDEAAASHVYSHRGSETKEIEHTFAAYDWAISCGSKNIEQDLVLSADGTLYISHDLTATRITGVNAYYSQMTDSEIDKLRTKDGQKILKLSDVFDKYGDSVNYIIELKDKSSATIEAFRKTVDKYGLKDHIVAQCFQLDVLKTLEEYYPDMPKMHVSLNDQWSFENALTKDYVDIVSVNDPMMTKDNCAKAHDSGKKFNVWVLDTEPYIKKAIDLGVDSYFTNDTELALSLEKKYRELKPNEE